MLCRPDHRHRAAAAIDKHHRLARSVQRLEQFHLHIGQRDVQAITAAKTDVIHRHLLAFKPRVQSTHIDDHVRRRRRRCYGGSHCFRRRLSASIFPNRQWAAGVVTHFHPRVRRPI